MNVLLPRSYAAVLLTINSMLGLTKKHSEVQTGSVGGIGAVAAPDVSLFHVTTIPAKFLPKSTSGHNQSLIKRIVLWVGGGAIISGLLIFGTSLLVKSIRNQEVVDIRTNINIPKPPPINTNVPPSVETPVLIEQTIGSCAFSAESVGKDQSVTLGSYQTKAYTASYFCPIGSVTVQVFQFADQSSLEGRIRGLSDRYVGFLDSFVQNVNDRSKVVWGSGLSLLQISVNSLAADDGDSRLILDEYAKRYIPNTNLPWPLVDKSQPQTPEERDQKRVSDIKKIQIALEFYKIDNGIYPDALDPTLDARLSNYLPQVPENPEPGGTSYAYLKTVGGQSYELRFVLEIGASGYPSGELIARPQGIIAENQSRNTVLPNSSDIDADGLTDIEEQVWTTSPTVADSDVDTFSDGEEVKNAYDPTLPGKKLESSSLVKSFLSSRDGFTVLYPTRWTTEEREGGMTMFSSESKEDFFQILVEPAPANISLFNWYRSEFPDVDENNINTIVISGTSYAILSPDRLTVYALSHDRLFTISYTPGIKEHLDYQSTFAMFLKTLKFFDNPNQ